MCELREIDQEGLECSVCPDHAVYALVSRRREKLLCRSCWLELRLRLLVELNEGLNIKEGLYE